MKIHSISIKFAIELIQKNKLFLPPIQRDFVWDMERMQYLYDSLFRGYPINNFVLWKLEPQTAQKYPLHQFVRTFSEKIFIKKEPAPHNILEKDIWAVVDGQQRLSSLYIGLSGIYKYKEGRKRNVEANLIASKLCFNTLSNINRDSDDNLFDFWSEEDRIAHEPKNITFEVGKVLLWSNPIVDIENAYRELFVEVKQTKKKTVETAFVNNENRIKQNLQRLYKMVNEPCINYLEIEEQDLDEVVEIFTRINSGGMILKKSDLLFSTLVSSWIDGEDEINEMVEFLVNQGISINKDFVMRTCIVLSDLPTKYRLESFNKKNAQRIKGNWQSIKEAFYNLAEILPNIGYSYKTGLSENALIPILYYIKNGGSIKSTKALNQLKLYYVVSQVNGVFGGQGDQVLDKVRTEIKNQLSVGNQLDFGSFAQIKLPGNKSFQMSEQRLKELISTTKYGSPHAYFILSLLYKNIDLKARKYEVDHLHPRSKFNKSNLNSLKIQNETTINDWMNRKKDLLANLQLMDSRDNNNKKSKLLIEYLGDKSRGERDSLIEENLLPQWKIKKLMELQHFDEFIEWRSKQLFIRLKRIFKSGNE